MVGAHTWEEARIALLHGLLKGNHKLQGYEKTETKTVASACA